MELLNNRLNHIHCSSYQVAKLFYLLFWLLKPFYLLESGSMQLGDICLGISFLIVLLSDEMHFRVDKEDVPLFFFVIAVAAINLIYAAVYQNTEFIKPIFYFIFNFICVYVTRLFLEDKNFISRWNAVLKLNLLLQLLVFVLDMGRWYSVDRYMGTYNDPNQLGFALLSTYCLIYCLNRKLNTRHQWLFFLIALFLIFQTSSVGMFFGIALIFVFEQYFRLAIIKSKEKKAWYIAYLAAITGVLVYACGYFMLVVTGVVETDINMLRRIVSKFTGDSVFEEFIDDRALWAVINEPIRMLYGAGEGCFWRFSHTGHELHSTWISILYYYGISPFCILYMWIKKQLKNIDLYVIPVYLCVFFEAFTLINHRQPSFWMLIFLGSILKKK